MTSINNYWEIGANYKQQWAGFEDASRTITASVQYPFQGKNMSVGMFLLSDQTHPLLYNAVGFTYNYQLKLNLAKEDYFIQLTKINSHRIHFTQVLVQVSCSLQI